MNKVLFNFELPIEDAALLLIIIELSPLTEEIKNIIAKSTIPNPTEPKTKGGPGWVGYDNYRLN